MTSSADDLANVTDLGNAERFVALLRDELRYVPSTKGGHWMHWGGQNWIIDDLAAVHAAKRVAAVIRDEAQQLADGVLLPQLNQSDRDAAVKKLRKHADASESASHIKAMVELARTDPRIQVQADELDQKPHLIACANGTFDIELNELRDADPDDLITRNTGVAYDEFAVALEFEDFVDWAMGGDQEMVEFLQTALGCSITGFHERSVFVLHGVGSNGKGTLIETVRSVIGGPSRTSYAQTVRKDEILDGNRGSSATPSLARALPKRFVTVNELKHTDRLGPVVKEIAGGGDTLSVRALYEGDVDAQPSFKLWMSSNAKPSADGMDRAIWDRLRLIPFEQRIADEDKDPMLKQHLTAQAEGILRWLLDGAVRYFRQGAVLKLPQKVVDATEAYRDEQSTFDVFMEETVEVTPDGRLTYRGLLDELRQWERRTGTRLDISSERRLSSEVARWARERDIPLSRPRKNSVRHVGGLRVIIDAPFETPLTN